MILLGAGSMLLGRTNGVSASFLMGTTFNFASGCVEGRMATVFDQLGVDLIIVQEAGCETDVNALISQSLQLLHALQVAEMDLNARILLSQGMQKAFEPAFHPRGEMILRGARSRLYRHVGPPLLRRQRIEEFCEAEAVRSKPPGRRSIMMSDKPSGAVAPNRSP